MQVLGIPQWPLGIVAVRCDKRLMVGAAGLAEEIGDLLDFSLRRLFPPRAFWPWSANRSPLPPREPAVQDSLLRE